jgi:hypothetical protein
MPLKVDKRGRTQNERNDLSGTELEKELSNSARLKLK